MLSTQLVMLDALQTLQKTEFQFGQYTHTLKKR